MSSVNEPVEPPMSANTIPDLEEILENVINMVQFMNSPDLLDLKNRDKKQYDDTVYFKYRELISPKIINILLEDINNLNGIIEMFEKLNAIKMGKLDIETETDNFAVKIENEYIYPKYGGKEKFFEMLKKQSGKN